MEEEKIFAALDAESLLILQSLVDSPMSDLSEQPSQSACVKFMITKKDESDLRSLGYSQKFINSITPDLAASIIQSGRKAEPSDR